VELFCEVLNQRLIVIDDQEFQGKKQSLAAKFLTMDQLKLAAELLN